MKKIQKYIMMGASLLIACLLTMVGVLAAGNITTVIEINIEHDPNVSALIRASTYSNNASSAYFQPENTTEATFNQTKSALIFDGEELTANINNFKGSSSFQFDDNGVLKFFFLIENNDLSATLTYSITLTYGENPVPFSLNEAESSNRENVFLLNKHTDTTKSLCTIAFTANEYANFSGEDITIDIKLSKTKVAPIEFNINNNISDTKIFVSTNSNFGGPYYQGTPTETSFTTGVEGNSALIFNASEVPATINTFIKSDSFRFNKGGDEEDDNLELYFLFENYDTTNTLTYTIKLTYGANGAELPVDFTLVTADTSDLTDVVVNEKSGANPTRSLCKIVFNTTKENYVLYGEQINMNITLTKTPV